jgi:hypothetical protein
MRTVAVVPRGEGIDFAMLAQCTQAVQVQIIRHFTPSWHIQAAVGAFPSIDAAPASASYVFVTRDTNGNGGMHFEPMKPDEAPFAIVRYRNEEMLSILLSHEILEMLVDPSGKQLVPGPDPLDPTRSAQFLLEICDPCNDISYPVQEAGGRHVSDFCLPAFFGKTGGTTFTCRNAIDAAFTVASGGYLTWVDADKQWHQFDATTGPCRIVDIDPELAQHALASHNLRGVLDRRDGDYGGGGWLADQSEKRIAMRSTAIRKERQAIDKRAVKRRTAIKAALKRLGIDDS